jgi:hypothetical protein
VIGCSTNHHVNIPAPPASLTPEQRVQAFDTYRQAGRGVEWTTTCGKGGCMSSSEDILVLHNGQEVRHAADLLPVLAPDSEAAREAQAAQAAEHRSSFWKHITFAGFVGFLVVTGVGFHYDSDPLLVLGIGGGLGTMLGGGIGWVKNDIEVTDRTKTVFAQYDESLAKRFEVCVNGLAVVPCESSTPGAPPPVAVPDPALRSLPQK